ncbi:MAG TPA: NAD-dependent epimerase/dehydratase family protein [Ilumatobacteraceae bacterium]|nr:NAD-dependent epimerase/dehydratase family protein [Ilumatobacteraceae bacterium]
MHDLRVGVTGVNGYVGGVVAAAVAAAGGDAVGFSSSPRFGQIEYRLGAPLRPESVEGLTAVVHAAHDFSAEPARAREVNTEGSLPLLKAAHDADVPVVLVSSLAAFVGCQSAYGRAKLELEQRVFEAGGRVLRAGVVFGDGAGGIVGSLNRAVSALPAVPIFAPHSPTYVTEAQALGRLVVWLASGTGALGTRRPVLAAADLPISFVSLVRHLGGVHGRHVRTIPVPTRLGLLTLRLGERLNLPMPFRSDSLVALAHPIPADQVVSLDASPVHFPGLPDWKSMFSIATLNSTNRTGTDA